MDLICLKCGGPLPPEAARAPVTCAFCGTTSVPPPEVVVVGRLRPLGIPTDQPEERRLPCPRCADYLVETRVHETVLSACKGCGGVWLDAATVARLRQARSADVDAAAARIAARVISLAPPDRTLTIACPVCRQHLRRVAIPGMPQVIDVCDAHGTWFDRAEADELSLFISAYETIRAGGVPGEAVASPAAASPGFLSRVFGWG
jgi:Zn-finger nucleic acid-binding protein